MTSSSPEPRLLRGDQQAAVSTAVLGADLRTGQWTRWGDQGVLGDATTEATLHGLAERSRRAAAAQGYAKGWAEGRRAGEARARAAHEEEVRRRQELDEQHRQEQARRIQALEAASRELRARLDEARATLESHAVEVAVQITEAVLGREVETGADSAVDAVRRVLDVLPSDVAVFTLRMHPADLAAVDPDVLADHSVTLLADPSVERGGAVAETDTMVVDASVSAAMARVREVLLP